MSELKFKAYNGDLIGLPTDNNHFVFRWNHDDCKILFSVSRLGNSASCHFASDRSGLRKLRQAINEFCEFCFEIFPWCRMIIAKVNIPSVERLIKQLGFKLVVRNNDKSAWMRC